MKTLVEYLDSFRDNGICQDSSQPKRFQIVLDFQDFVGHQSLDNLYDSYVELDQSYRKLFVWSVCSTLAYETSVEIINRTTIADMRFRAIREIEADFDEREIELLKRGLAFKACKKSVYKKIRNLQNEVSRLKEILTIRNKSDLRLCERVSELKEQLSSAFDKQQEYVDNAMKFRKIQELLS